MGGGQRKTYFFSWAGFSALGAGVALASSALGAGATLASVAFAAGGALASAGGGGVCG